MRYLTFKIYFGKFSINIEGPRGDTWKASQEYADKLISRAAFPIIWRDHTCAIVTIRSK